MTLHRWDKNGVLKKIEVGGHRRYRRSDVEAVVQAKLSLDINKGGKNETVRFTIVGLWGRYILKPQTDRFAHLPELEDLTMHLAELLSWQVLILYPIGCKVCHKIIKLYPIRCKLKNLLYICGEPRI